MSKEFKYLSLFTTFFSFTLFHEVWIALFRGTIPGGGDGDTGQVIWWLKVNSDALFNNKTLLLSEVGNYPDGINALWNQSLIGFSLLFAPITKLASPILTYNILVILLPFLNTFGLWFLLKTLDRNNRIVWSLIFGFGPLLPLHILGHINIATIGILPIIVALVYRYIIAGKLSNLIPVIFLICFQFFTSSEVLLLTGVLILIVLLLEKDGKNNILKLKRCSHILVTSLLMLIYPIIHFLQGPQSVDGPVQNSDFWKNDLSTLLYPPKTNLMYFTSSVGDWGQSHEAIGYLGVFLIVYLIYFAFKKAGRIHYPILALFFYILSLGPTLHSFSYQNGLSMPFKLIDKLPVISNALPARLSILTLLLIILYLSSKKFSDLLSPYLSIGIPALIFISLLMAPLNYDAKNSLTPQAVESQRFCNLAEGKNVYIIPIPRPGYVGGMLWQSMCKQEFKTYGTYNIIESSVAKRKPTWSNFGVLDLVALKTVGVDFRGSGALQVNKEALLAEIEDKKIQIIVVESKNDVAISFFTMLFGSGKTLEDVTYWDIL